MCFKKGFIINSLFIFSIFFIILSGADFLTTSYALNNHIGYEANGAMSGIVNNTIAFLSVKTLFVTVIIMLMSKCLKQSKKISHIGMRLIIFMMVFVVANNLLVIDASALSFNNLSIGGTGSINTANGYFDDPQSAFDYTGTRNIYAITETTQVNILEPISWVGGTSPTAYTAINSSLGTLKDAVVYHGYLYFVDGTTLKKKKTRNFETSQTCESTDTTAGGCISTISTGVGETLRVYDDVLYFTKGTNSLRHVDSEDNEVTDFGLTYPPSGSAAQFSGYAVWKNSGVLTIYYTGWVVAGGTTFTIRCTSSGCVTVTNLVGANQASTASGFTTTSYYYYYTQTTGGGLAEEYRYKTNNTNAGVDYITTLYYHSNRIYVGSISTIGLLAASSTSYETFNSNEVGTDSLPIVPLELTYDTATITSMQSTYYNMSNIYLEYNVVVNSIDADNILIDLQDYRWIISMTDPNGVSQDIVQSPACYYSGLLDYTCQVTSTMGIPPPTNGWIQGSWNAELYEVNIVVPNRALLATSSSFTVLNTSIENQSIIGVPIIPINAGSGATALTTVDNWTAMFGLGINPVSKFMFAMMWITAFSVMGFIITKFNLNGGIMMALLPFTFFIYIAYLPLWTVVIITMIVGMKLFR